ncbi:MAG TPA: DUF255 domain-containing protein [Candidatus Polarisedimenticolia bacterium]|jgi:hypothetical protein
MAGGFDPPGGLESRARVTREASIIITLRGTVLSLSALAALAMGGAAAAPREQEAPAPPAAPASIRWNDWSADLFKRATELNKPVLLYVDTAWSRSALWNDEKIFTDPQVVKLTSEKWIPVRVERDRRPDIGQRYQLAVQAVSKGESGWPLLAFLYDTGEAMTGRAFVPLEDRMGKPGLWSLLEKTADYYAENRAKVGGLRELAMRSFDKEREIHRAPEITASLIEEVISGTLKGFDRENGGYGPPPRIPLPYPLELAALLHHRTGDHVVLDLLVTTLSGMERGAIYDRVGGGFHRAAGDVTWRYPEFEKLLNYNAPLLEDYLLGYQATGDPDYRRVAEGIVDYILTTLTDPAGGFYVAQRAAARADDPRADYYAVTEEEFRKAIPAGRETVARALFNVGPEGEVVIGPPPRSLMYLAMSRQEAARRLGIPEQDVRRTESEILEGLRRTRATRTPPPVEKTIYVDSCASGAAAMIEASRVLGRRDALEAGKAALDRLLAAMPKDGPFLHRVQPPPEAGIDTTLAMDHLMLAHAALAGYEAIGSRRYLDAARDLVERAVALFWDASEGGFYDIAVDPGAVGFMSVRRRLPNDTAYPSLNSLAARVLDRLWVHTRDESYHARAQTCLKGLIATLERLNHHDAGLALAVASSLWPPPRYLIIGREDDPKAIDLAGAAGRIFDPEKIVIRLSPGRDDEEISRLKLDRKSRSAYAVVCRADACSEPARDEAALKERSSPPPAAGVRADPGRKP